MNSLNDEADFASAVLREFEFVKDYGFAPVSVDAQRVQFRCGGIDLIVYVERMSVAAMEFSRNGRSYSLGNIVRLRDPGAARGFREMSFRGSCELVRALRNLTRYLRQYGVGFLRGDPDEYAALDERVNAWIKARADDVREEQIRPKAAEAFRQRRYKDAAALYAEIESRLNRVMR